MKKLILSMVCLLLLTTSCESSDSATYISEDYISGKWVFKEMGTINNLGVVVYQDYINQATCDEDNLNLENKAKTFSLNNFIKEGQTCVNKGFVGDFSIVNRDLFLTYTKENTNIETVYSIVSFTKTDLIISTSDDLGLVTFYKLSK